METRGSSPTHSRHDIGSKDYANATHQKHREDLNADADAETQLVHLKNTVTNEGKVNMAKVQDIIRALRRRYQTRANVQHIFKDWDKSGKGYISAEDIQTMLDKMGLSLNRAEAEMMLLSIDENGDQQVSLNEFLDLVFTHNDALSGLDFTNAEGASEEQIAADIKRKIEMGQKLRPMNQWKLFLQKNLNNIAMDLLAVDTGREYAVDIKDFMKVIERRAKIPEYLKQNNSDLLHDFIGSYTDQDSGKVDYRSLIDELRDFNYEVANAKKEGLENTNKAFKTSHQSAPRKTIYEDEYIVLDS